MKSILTRIVEFLKPCNHTWVKPQVIDDYDLRSGVQHKSVVCTCSKCGAVRTYHQGF